MPGDILALRPRGLSLPAIWSDAKRPQILLLIPPAAVHLAPNSSPEIAGIGSTSICDPWRKYCAESPPDR
jgi:hypothetical protein